MANSLLSVGRPSRRRRYQRAMRHVELLEPRTLMSATATLTQLPDNFAAFQGVYDSNDNLWFINYGGTEETVGVNLVRVADGAIQETYAVPDVNGGISPSSLLNGGNGHLYITDFNGAIDDFNLTTRSFSQYSYDVGPNSELADNAGHATMTSDGGLWIVGLGGVNPDSTGPLDVHINYVGRFDVNTHDFKYAIINDFDASVADAQAVYISAKDSHSVYVALQGTHGQDENLNWVAGTNRIATLNFDSLNNQVVTTGSYPINTGDPTTDTWGTVTGVAADTDGTVWISIGNADDGSVDPFRAPAYPSDRLVNMKINTISNQLEPLATVYLPGNESPLFVGNLQLDSVGRLWYSEQHGTHLGYFDTFEGTVTQIDYPAGMETPFRMFTNNAGSELTLLTTDSDGSDGFPYVQVELGTTTVEFSGSAYDQGGAENIAIDNILLATFTAPEGTYTANITWGDGTTTSVSTIDLGDNTYGVVISSKTFATQGTFAGMISIVNESAVEMGTLAFSSVISDTPLTITSLAVDNPNGKFANLSLTFTDDLGSAASWFMATVSWGDNSTSAGIVVKDTTTPGQYFVIANHKYKKKGTYTVNASVTTSELNVTVATATATVTVVI